MKRTILPLILILLTANLYGQSITINENGIVKCAGVEIGTTEVVNGDTYEVVDRNLLIQRRDEDVDLTRVCVSNVTAMSGMFANSPFNQPIGNWDVSNVTGMSSMFRDSQFNQPIGNWDVSNVTDMRLMFRGSPFNQPIGNWDVSKVKVMVQMFEYSQFNQPIGKWDVSSVGNMYQMFHHSQFNQPIGDWDVSSVEQMGELFAYSQFNQPIGDWDVSSVRYMDEMFRNSPFNQPIGDWDLSRLQTMGGMFAYSSFNQSVENWNVRHVENMSWLFYGSSFNQPIQKWNVRSVRGMQSMFGESPFNQPIGDWNVSSVGGMRGMFQNSQFDQPIGNWDVKNVMDMREMFQNSPFNQPLNIWCVPIIKEEPSNFSTDSSLTAENKPNWGTCPFSPDSILLLAPENNSTNVFRNLQLSWKPDSNATIYELRIYEGIIFEPHYLKVVDVNISDTLYVNPTLFKSNTRYIWTVRGINENFTDRDGPTSHIWSFTTGVETSIDTDEIPAHFVLNQNYPNPFNPTTRIQFSLPVSTVVRLEVFSVLGQRTATLLNEQMPVGVHTVPFDARSLSSGVYIYRLTTPEFTQTRLMNLIK